ncbi:MAG: hypothetical protein JSU06_13110 [Actinobacteria bacterium]|nr:hypothetical protein [Actinomycetota bacterium]
MRRVVAFTALAALALAAVAVAATLPTGGKAFTTPPTKHRAKFSLTLVTSPDGRSIEEGGAAIGSQYAISGGSIECPKAKKQPGFHETPFLIFGFPATALTMKGGTYGFTAHLTQRETNILGSTAKAFTLKVKITGTVVGATTIEGTVSAKGGSCTTKTPLAFKLKPNPKVPVAPGA